MRSWIVRFGGRYELAKIDSGKDPRRFLDLPEVVLDKDGESVVMGPR